MTKKRTQDISRLLRIIHHKGPRGVRPRRRWCQKVDGLFADKVFEKSIRGIIRSKCLSSEYRELATELFGLLLEGEQSRWDHEHIDDLRRFTSDYLSSKLGSKSSYLKEPFLSAIACQRALFQHKATTGELARAKADAFRDLLAIIQRSKTIEEARLPLLGLSYAVSEVDEHLCSELDRLLDSAASIPGIKGDYFFLSARRWTRQRLEAEKTPVIRLQPDERSRLICVASTKGGVGKTTVAAALAYNLALKNRNVCVVETDTTGPALLWQLDWRSGYFKSFRQKSFPFFHHLVLTENWDNIDQYLHHVTLPEQKKSGEVKLIAGSSRPTVVDQMERAWQTRPVNTGKDIVSGAIEELIRVLLMEKAIDHVILDMSPGIAGTASLAMRATLAIGGCMVFVVRSRAVDIVTMALEAEGIMAQMEDQGRSAIVINAVRPGLLDKITDPGHLVKLLEAHPQTLAYFEGFPPEKVRDFISWSLERIVIERAIPVEEMSELRFLNEPGKPEGFFHFFQDTNVKKKVVDSIGNVLSRFDTWQWTPKR